MLNQTTSMRETHPRETKTLHVKEMVEGALKLISPAWPLQNTVAVNPFWFLRDQTFEVAIQNVSKAIQTHLLMPLSFYHDKIKEGEITHSSIREAYQRARTLWPELPLTFDEAILNKTPNESRLETLKTFAEYLDDDKTWSSRITAEFGKYAAAYLDDKQSVATFPWSGSSFWKAWTDAQEYDKTLQIFGVNRFTHVVRILKAYDALEAIEYMAHDMSLNQTPLRIYLQRLVATISGWSTQFKYLEWQRSLGHSVKPQSSLLDALAVRFAYDYLLYKSYKETDQVRVAKWQRELEKTSTNLELSGANSNFQLQYVFQLAWELSYQAQLTHQIKNKGTEKLEQPRAQLVFCIDVRSEMIRRHIENADPRIQTIGFAGFFGIPFSLNRTDQDQPSHRLPVLLKPAFVHSEVKQKDTGQTHTSTELFRSLRKNSLSSLSYVELFGPIYVQKMIQAFYSQFTRKVGATKIPKRFDDKTKISHEYLVSIEGDPLQTSEKVKRVAAILRHLGLTSHFAEQVWIVGHGSATTNNAFGSGLDCGACGGHAGDANARLLVTLLNDPAIRKGLLEENIIIPDKTRFVAAIHETVTDEIHLLDKSHIQMDLLSQINAVHNIIKKAATETREERQFARSGILDPNSKRRTENWSEVRPEWGLAGNACFIVAPRERTKGINLNSRSFLHDYDWRKDSSNGYQTLELIMTAPMVVTNWINLQYYASTVAPGIYGAGNKVLHNLTNEAGVVEGNGGDLRVGLPIQSVHDGVQFIHDPLRLTVMIEAPQDQIESIIQKHETVRQLIENEWLHLLHIDPTDLTIRRRLRNGTYTEVKQPVLN